ncbi:MAG: DUF1858 domain-containing protein [Acidobacteriota bacterium]
MWTVAEVVARCPQAASVFTRFQMACVGCPMAPFEALSEAAAAYELEPKMMLREFRRASREKLEDHNDQV